MKDVVIPKHTVIQYVRNKKRVPFGVIGGVKMDDGFGMSYSLCNKKDRFNKKMALKIAIGRVYQGVGCFGDFLYGGRTLPNEIRKMKPAFLERCKKYYKVS